MATSGLRDPLIGARLDDRFDVLATIGDGGMGRVYRARDRLTEKTVAVKVLYDSFARDPDYVARFRREAHLAGRVDDPRCVTIEHSSQTESGQLYLVMELVEGSTLRQIITADGALPVDRAVEISRQLAGALAAIHAAGIVHRDVKPDNIMVLSDTGAVKLLDFGIAKSGEMQTRVTQTGQFIGSPSYMAPEYLTEGECGPKSDMYAWGVVTYEMLTGAGPFEATTPAAILTKQLKERPRPLRRVRRDVPKALGRLVDRALEKQPSRRPADMGAVVATLESVQRTLQTMPSAAGRGSRAVGGSLMVIAAILVAVIAAGFVERRDLHARIARLSAERDALGQRLGGLEQAVTGLKESSNRLEQDVATTSGRRSLEVDTVTAKRLNITDAKGRSRVVVEAGDTQGWVTILRSDGKVSTLLGGGDNNGWMRLYKGDKSIVFVGSDTESGVLEIYDKAEKALVTVGTYKNANGGLISVMNGKLKRVVQIGSYLNNKGALILYDGSGGNAKEYP